MTSDSSNGSVPVSADEFRERIIFRFEKAKAENYEFGLIAERIFVWLIKYTPGDAIPTDYWDSYRKLSGSVNLDSSGKLVFTEAQYAVMTMVNAAMKKAGMAITLPDNENTNQKLSLVIENFPYKSYLSKSFFPPVLAKCGQDMEVTFFSSLIVQGINKALEIVKNKILLIETVGFDEALQIYMDMDAIADIVTLHVPRKMIETFWENPEVAKYAIQLHENIYKTTMKD